MDYGHVHQLISMWVSRDCHATDALELNMYESSTKETSGCASNLLAHEDLGHLRKPIVGIYKPSSIMKNSTSIWKWQHMRLAIWRTWCYFEAQVWKKIVAIVPFLLFFFFLGPFFFLWPFLPFFSLGQCSNNDDHHTYIDYNSILQLDTRTKYDSIWMPSAVYRDVQWIKSDIYENNCMVALPQLRCQLHDHAWQYDNMKRVIWTERWKVAWQYISEWICKCHDR